MRADPGQKPGWHNREDAKALGNAIPSQAFVTRDRVLAFGAAGIDKSPDRPSFVIRAMEFAF